MALLLITFKYEGALDVKPEHEDPEFKYLLNQVVAKLKEGIVELVTYEETHTEEIDNHCDSNETYLEPHAIFEIRLDVDLEHVDLHDGGESLYYYVQEALELRDNSVSIYQCGQEPAIKTVIGIDVDLPG